MGHCNKVFLIPHRGKEYENTGKPEQSTAASRLPSYCPPHSGFIHDCGSVSVSLVTHICLSLAWNICVSSNSLACSGLLTLQNWQVVRLPIHLPRDKGTSSKIPLLFTSTNRSPWVHRGRPDRGVASCPWHFYQGLSTRTSKGYGIHIKDPDYLNKFQMLRWICKLHGWEFVLCILGWPCESDSHPEHTYLLCQHLCASWEKYEISYCTGIKALMLNTSFSENKSIKSCKKL